MWRGLLSRDFRWIVVDRGDDGDAGQVWNL
jgi:hypothetical protein